MFNMVFESTKKWNKYELCKVNNLLTKHNLTLKNMKKLFISAAAVCLFSLGSFANDNVKENKEVKENVVVIVEETQSSRSGSLVKSCHIVIKGTIDKKKVDIDITVDEDDCAAAAGRMLKEFLK
jgi:hypothetical protein